MAGGEGSRLRPLTSNTPKPMLPVANRPMMEHIVALCRRHGFTDVVATVAYLADVIRTYFGDGGDFGVSMRYAVEDVPLGTAGSVGNARALLDETFLVISGDALTDVDLGAVADAHRRSGSMATIVLYRAENPLEFGIVITREDGTIERFLEKPTWGQVFSDTVNTGIYVLEPEIFDFITTDGPSDFSQDVFPALLEKGIPIQGYVADGYWEDVGNLEAFAKAHRDVLDGRVDVEMPGFEIAPRVWIGPDCEIHPDATIDGPALVGAHCNVAAGAHVRDHTVLGDNVVVRADASLQRSIVFSNAFCDRATSLTGAIVGKGADLREGARADNDVVLGDGVTIGERATLSTAVKVYPFKSVEAGAVVNTSVVWESRATRNLFGRRGVTGLANIDITPQLAVRLGMAYGSSQTRGALVTMSRDSSRAARALKRAFTAGLNATGISVDDLEIAPVPVTRFSAAQNAGGVTIRSSASDPQQIEIRFFTSDGKNLPEQDQRKIERNFAREDFRRVLAEEIGDIYYPPRTWDFYANALVTNVDLDAIHRRAAKVVVDYGFGTSSVTLPSVLERLGCDVLAINPYTADPATRRHLRDDPERLGELVRTSGSDFGLRFDADAERADLVDDRGRLLDWTTTTLLYVRQVCRAHPRSRIVLPVSETEQAERIAVAAGGTIEWAQTSSVGLMDAADAPGVTLGIGADGLIVPRVLPAPSASAQFVLTLELLAALPEALSAVVDGLPRVHLLRDSVPTPWERKGTVMRTLVEESDPELTTLVDGVKVHTEDRSGWALVLPDPEEPLCHLWVEGADDAQARGLLEQWRTRVATIAAED